MTTILFFNHKNEYKNKLQNKEQILPKRFVRKLYKNKYNIISHIFINFIFMRRFLLIYVDTF